MTVPKHICLIIDYNAGLSVPSTGTWPRYVPVTSIASTSKNDSWPIFCRCQNTHAHALLCAHEQAQARPRSGRASDLGLAHGTSAARWPGGRWRKLLAGGQKDRQAFGVEGSSSARTLQAHEGRVSRLTFVWQADKQVHSLPVDKQWHCECLPPATLPSPPHFLRRCPIYTQSYCEAIFPAPNSLTLPMCWSRERLQQLQHEAIVDAALQQQVTAALSTVAQTAAAPAAPRRLAWLTVADLWV